MLTVARLRIGGTWSPFGYFFVVEFSTLTVSGPFPVSGKPNEFGTICAKAAAGGVCRANCAALKEKRPVLESCSTLLVPGGKRATRDRKLSSSARLLEFRSSTKRDAIAKFRAPPEDRSPKRPLGVSG